MPLVFTHLPIFAIVESLSSEIKNSLGNTQEPSQISLQNKILVPLLTLFEIESENKHGGKKTRELNKVYIKTEEIKSIQEIYQSTLMP